MNVYLHGDGQTCISELTPLYEKLPAACEETRCYNYLILDSEKLKHLCEYSSLSVFSPAGHKGFKLFVDAVLYVGKGTEKDGGMQHQRSHDHIHEAHKSNCKVRINHHNAHCDNTPPFMYSVCTRLLREWVNISSTCGTAVVELWFYMFLKEHRYMKHRPERLVWLTPLVSFTCSMRVQYSSHTGIIIILLSRYF